MRRALVIASLAIASPAAADDDAPPPRPAHGSIAAGGEFLLTGDEGARQRAFASIEFEPAGSRAGGVLSLHGFDAHHGGIATAGFVFEAAAARPRLAIDLHADLGLDLDRVRPAAGGGVRATVGIVGPLGVVLEANALAVIDGTDHSRFELTTVAALAYILHAR
ncbi:MAG TPA: hypothetical protein VGM88_02790 [Kofleriaceae bacterium]|jgi:hypothetical protein